MQYAGTALGQGDTFTLSARNSIARTCGALRCGGICVIEQKASIAYEADTLRTIGAVHSQLGARLTHGVPA
jgi:hypothetical protein